MTGFDPGHTQAFLTYHWRFKPVDATFMGAAGHDDRLPPSGPDTVREEAAARTSLLARVAATEEPEDPGLRIDRAMILGELRAQQRLPEARHWLYNPAWYSGEAAFAIVGLLLPQSAPVDQRALVARLDGIGGFLAEGARRLEGRAVPLGWRRRAQNECAAMQDFLLGPISRHPEYSAEWAGPAAEAARGFSAFGSGIADLADADPACGEAFLSTLMTECHALPFGPHEALARAETAFASLGAELADMARAIDPGSTWQDQIAGLGRDRPQDADAVMGLFRRLDAEALEAGAALVTPAWDYGLEYRWMPDCFADVSASLYFLFYRSPPALRPGSGSVYWVGPVRGDGAAFLAANPTAIIKTIHSSHHGSIGHHTQNARARAAASRIARIAGTDCALGLAMLGSGTLIEGWACYAEDLLIEAPGFYAPTEILLLKQFERRNAASVIVDIKLHLGHWTPAQCAAFYRDEAGFAAARVEAEIVRNSMLPGSRLMYWIGVEAIRDLRRRWRGGLREFHDMLLSFGHVPVTLVGREMDRAGLLSP